MRRRREQSMEQRFLRGGAVTPERARRSVSPTAAMIVRGLARFAAFVATAVAVSVGVALLIGWLTGSNLWRSALLGLYFGGAVLIIFPLLSWGGRPVSVGGYGLHEIDVDPELRRRRQGELWAYVFVGLAVIGIGVLFEALTG
jgi:hypothetical protein